MRSYIVHVGLGSQSWEPSHKVCKSQTRFANSRLVSGPYRSDNKSLQAISRDASMSRKLGKLKWKELQMWPQDSWGGGAQICLVSGWEPTVWLNKLHETKIIMCKNVTHNGVARKPYKVYIY